MKLLKEPAYSHEEANAAVGQGTDNGIAAFRVNPEDVIDRVSRDRIMALKKASSTGRAESLSSEMEVEVEQQIEAPRLVEQAYDDDL